MNLGTGRYGEICRRTSIVSIETGLLILSKREAPRKKQNKPDLIDILKGEFRLPFSPSHTARADLFPFSKNNTRCCPDLNRDGLYLLNLHCNINGCSYSSNFGTNARPITPHQPQAYSPFRSHTYEQ